MQAQLQRSRRSTSLALWALPFLLCGGIPCQEILWQRVGIADVLQFGEQSVFLGDVDGDGFDDLVHQVGVYTPLPGVGTETELHVLSGRDGTTLRIDKTPSVSYAFLRIAPAGDWDDDGIVDYASQRLELRPPYGPNVVEVRSGRDGTVLFAASGPFAEEFGDSLAGDLDLNGNGRPDLVIGAFREGRHGVLYGYENDGSLLFRRELGENWSLISNLGSLRGDLDRDGCDDFLVWGLEPQRRGAASVFSGRTQEILVTGIGPFYGAGAGVQHLLGCGDVNGDGVLDFAGSSNGGFGTFGLVVVFSGATGERLLTLTKGVASSFGEGLAAGDLDLDGVEDLLVGINPCGQATALDWYSLRDGSLVTQVCRPGTSVNASGFGRSISIGRPQPNNPFPVFVSADASYRLGTGSYVALPGEGQVTMFRAAPAGVRSPGTGCPGTLATTPRIGLTAWTAVSGGAAPERAVRIHLSNTPAASNAFLLLGLGPPSTHPLPVASFGFQDCALYTQVQLAPMKVTGSDGINAGYAYFDFPFPLASGLGLSLTGQWLVVGRGESAPGALSGALSWQH